MLTAAQDSYLRTGAAGLRAPAVRFRRLAETDNSQACALFARCAIACRDPFVTDRGSDFFAWPREVFEDHEYVALFDDTRLIGTVGFGYATGSIGSTPLRVGWVIDARVDPRYRGRKLLGRAVRQMVPTLLRRVDAVFYARRRDNGAVERAVTRMPWPSLFHVSRRRMAIVTSTRTGECPGRLEIVRADAKDADIALAALGAAETPCVRDHTLESRSDWSWSLARRNGRTIGVLALSAQATGRFARHPLQTAPRESASVALVQALHAETQEDRADLLAYASATTSSRILVPVEDDTCAMPAGACHIDITALAWPFGRAAHALARQQWRLDLRRL